MSHVDQVRWVPTRPSQAVASARMRCYAPMAALAARGWDSALLQTRDWFVGADVVVFQKAYGTRHLRLARWLRRRGTRVVLDLCDNHFEHPKADALLADRARRLREMVALADVVTASTPTLAQLIPHDSVVVVDDIVDSVERPPRTPSGAPPIGAIPAVAWFGNIGSVVPRFGLVDLEDILSELEAAVEVEPMRLVVCTSSQDAFEQRIAGRVSALAATFVPWSVDAQSEVLASAAVAVLPVTPNSFTVCKTANRVVTALLAGVPVVAGRIPSYEELAPFIRLGDWAANVVDLIRHRSAACAQVLAGQSYVRERFAPDAVAAQWERALRMALGS